MLVSIGLGWASQTMRAFGAGPRLLQRSHEPKLKRTGGDRNMEKGTGLLHGHFKSLPDGRFDRTRVILTTAKLHLFITGL